MKYVGNLKLTLPSDREVELTRAIVEWARGEMAAYKAPRAVEFCDALPKSSTGKVLWRQLQEAEGAK